MATDDFRPGYDPAVAQAHLRACDAQLAAVMARVGALRLQRRYPAEPFMALLRAIVYQQLSGKAAASIFARVCTLLPAGVRAPHALLACEDEQLRGAGLSRPKMAAARDLAEHAVSGRLPDAAALAAMADEAIIDCLTDIRGIGRWTVEMLLIFGLGRPDVLPVTDLGIRKGFARLRGDEELPAPEALRRAGERWRPYRSVASWYLWRILDTPG